MDEIQECPEARTSLKFFKCDGRYDVIGTGSLLGIQGYRENLRSIPVGYETVVEMHPMDFEEFLWANGMQDTAVDILRDCLEKEVPVPDALHKKMISLMLAYTVVGGMPNVVNTFVQSKNLALVLKMQRDIVSAYQDDMVKYADRSMKGKIRECFQSIPSQLSKENKKFQYNLIRKGSKASQYESSLQWLEDAGIICRCYNLNLPELPLDGNAVTNVFKVYMHDTGLFVSMLEDGTQYDILQGNLLGYKGAIFENLLADIFSKMARKLYYFKKDSGLEIDFVIRHQGQAKLIECKSTTGNAKSMKSVLGNPEKYHVEQGIKLGLYQIGRSGPILTLPLYMAFLLHQV